MCRVLAVLVTALSALALACVAKAEDLDPARLARGTRLLEMQGCTACHSLDGRISAGPTFLGRFGRATEVLVGGQAARVPFDAAYVGESLREPSRAIAKGFAPGVMPRFELTDEQTSAIVEALRALGREQVAPGAPEQPAPITWLALFVLLFVGGHLTLSGASTRAWLVRTMGERGFFAAYALCVAFALVGMVWAYSEAPYVELWPPLRVTRYVPLVVMPFALFLAVCGFSTRTPTRLGQAHTLTRGDAAIGILRVTRHPQLWSYVLWSLAHLPPNGDAASVLFFGGFAALSILGMLHIEHRREEAFAHDWERFAAVTSLFPGEAIIEGRNRFVFSEIGWGRVLATVALYVLLLFTHTHVFGASPWP